ncbi:MAG TPA: rRNA maturation RNase YbeY [Gemmatimonadaceae bacterium]|nr:rRNA maturation RNase YbeY [Gemmatimonadaceae bacterium]
MSLDISVASNGVRSPLGRERIANIARRVLRAEQIPAALVSVTLLGPREMARLNKTHLGHGGPTDVISFGFTRATPRDPVVGDVYLCPDVGRANARARRVPIREELSRLVVHGVLHVLGHDHPTGGDREASPMWLRQEQLLERIAGR